MLAEKLCGSGSVAQTYVDDVFAVSTFTGTGGYQTIANGIDLSGKGGLVWTKCRSGVESHSLVDTIRGVGAHIYSDTTAAQNYNNYLCTSFYSNGYQAIGDAKKYLSYTFRKSSKFFDIVTYTGTGVSDRVIAHALGGTPGVVLIKATSTTGEWWFSHRSVESDQAFRLNTTGGAASFGIRASTNSETTFTLAGTNNVAYANTNGVTYVAYLFAHDPTTDGLIQCGSFTTDGSGNATVNLGWESQFLLVKASSTTGDWIMLDTQRGWDLTSLDAKLLANSTAVETTASEQGEPTTTGFNFKGGSASSTYIFMAIRRSNKPPTVGTQVFMPSARTGTGANAVSTAAGFPPDLVVTKKRSSTTLTGARFVDRPRGKANHLDSTSNGAEVTTADTVTDLDSTTGVSIGADATTSAFNTSTHTYIDLFFKRAKGVFDITRWKGDGTTVARRVAHNLITKPKLHIYKAVGTPANSQFRDWFVGGEALDMALLGSESGSALARINTGAAAFSNNGYFDGIANASTVSVGQFLNESGINFVGYLFGDVAGVSKVWWYTGNGGTQNIDCGFTTGARFVLIRGVSGGDAFIWDSARGIVAGNDPHLSLNTTAAEVTSDDSIDPLTSGFTVNQVAATNINVNATKYVFVAIA